MGSMFPFLITGNLPWLPWLFKSHQEWLGNYISQFPQDCEMCLMDLLMFRFMVINLIFTFNERDFAPPVSILLSIHTRGMGIEVALEDGWKLSWVAQLSPPLLLPVFQCSLLGEYAFFDLHFLVNVTVEALWRCLLNVKSIQGPVTTSVESI